MTEKEYVDNRRKRIQGKVITYPEKYKRKFGGTQCKP